MHKLLIFIMLLTTGCSTIPTATFDTERLYVNCKDTNDQPIINIKDYKATFLSDIAYANFNKDLQRREIHISNNVTDKVPTSVVEFIAYHECGHHQYNHSGTSQTSGPRFLWTDQAYREEDDADCYAAKTYYQNNGRVAYQSMLTELNAVGWLPAARIKRIKHCTK